MRTIFGGLLVSLFVAGLCTPALAQTKRDPVTNRDTLGGWYYLEHGKADPHGCPGVCVRKYPDVGRGPQRDRLDCEVECKANPAKFGVKATKPGKGN